MSLEHTQALPRSTTRPASFDVSIAIVVALALGLALSWGRVMQVWQTGAFFDSDDAMRMVQVRDLLAGQNWFDMTAYRLDPPHGQFMHWSRIVDAPLAVLMRLFELFLPAVQAERLVRLVFPFSMQVLLFIAIARAAQILAGPRAVIPAIFLCLLGGIMFVQFQPGRIDHHAPQIVLLAFMLGFMVEALDPTRAKQAAWAGALAAVSLGISIENLPFILVLSAALPLAFILRGAEQRPALLAYALGIGVGLPLVMLATVSPSRWLGGACDGYSAAHLTGGLAGALALAVLAQGVGKLTSIGARLIAAGAAAGFVLGVLTLTYPACLRDPLIGVDPLVRDVWLNHITEAMSLPRFLAERPWLWPVLIMPLVLALAAAVYGAARNAGLTRARWLLVLATIVAGAGMMFWQVRISTSVGPLAVLPGAAIIALLRARMVAAGKALFAGAVFLLLVPFSAFGWVLMTGEVDPAVEARSKASAACLTPKAFAPLANLPTGLVLSAIDAGPFLLAHTAHSVLGGPYHRNNIGNHLVADALLSKPTEAEAIVRSSGAKYVVLCPGQSDIKDSAGRAPTGLAQALVKGEVPKWLAPVAMSDTPYLVFTIRP